MRRRSVLGAAAAGVAVGAGLAGAWWRSAHEAARPDIWTLKFATPEGGELALRSLRGQPLLLNFWATWCPPCVRELPLLDAFQRRRHESGWRVAGLAVDNLAPVVEFLRERPVGFAIGLAGAEGAALARALGNESGALPFTVVFDRRGNAAQRKLGVIEPADLQRWADELT